MNHRLFWGISLLFSLLTMSALSINAQAKSFRINQYHVQINLQKNGDALVHQQITYHFNGNFNGVYYNQDTAGIGRLSQAKVTVGKQRLQQSTSAAPQTYSLTQQRNNTRFKVYYPAHNQTVTFNYQYRLGGVITNYRDTAEMNWKIIGSAWDVALKNVRINVQLPAQHISTLQAWTHGPLSGQTNVSKTRGQVTMTIATVPENTAVESHLLFPTTVTPTAPTKATNRKQAAQQLETKLAHEANQKRQLAVLIPLILTVGLLFAAAGHLFGQWRWFKRHAKHQVNQLPVVHRFDIPSYSPVASQSILTRQAPNTKAFSAWLLELAAAGELQIIPEADTYRLTETDKLTAVHRKDPLLHFMFNVIGQPDSDTHLSTVTLAEISDYQPTGDSNPLSDHFEDWADQQYQAVTAYNFFDNLNQQIRVHAHLLLWLNFTLMVLGILTSAFMGHSTWISTGIILTVLIFGLSLAVSLSAFRGLSPYTQAGEEAVAEVKGFKLMMTDIGQFDRSQVGDLILWEQLLPYAVSLGVAKQVIKAMQTEFTQAELVDGLAIYYPLFFYGNFGTDTFSTQFDSDFGSAITSNDSSISGGSGGFSGGSSGGFGGGSGGGAF